MKKILAAFLALVFSASLALGAEVTPILQLNTTNNQISVQQTGGGFVPLSQLSGTATNGTPVCFTDSLGSIANCSGSAATVSSVAIAVPSGLTIVSGSPITTSGTITIGWSGTIPASSLPNPSASTLGGIESLASTSHEWINAISTAGVPSATQPAFTDISGTAAVGQGGTGLTSGTSGGVLAFTASGTLASSGALTINLPVIGGGAGAAPTVGSRLGNTTKFVTANTSASYVAGDCVQFDSNYNITDAGGACTTGGGGGTVSSGTANDLAYYGSSGTTVTGLSTANNGTLITSGSGVPSISSTLPAAVQGNITAVGTIASGTWDGTVIGATYGGTGENNGSATITLGGSLTFSGAYTTAFTVSGNTAVTLPTSGTLLTSSVTTLSSLSTVGTIGTGTWQGTAVAAQYGGTGLNGASATNGQLLIGNGSGYTLAALTAGNNIGVTNGSGSISLTAKPSGSSSQVQFNSSGSFAAAAGFTFDGTSIASLGVAGTSVGGLKLLNATSGYVEITPPTGALGSAVLTAPAVTDTIAVLGTADQTLSGGANVTPYSIGTVSSGTTTIDCGKSPLQYLTNGGAFTFHAPSSDGSCVVLMTNNSSAGTVTFSGFTEGANTGDTPNTTTSAAFSVSVYRISGVSHYLVSAYQ